MDSSRLSLLVLLLVALAGGAFWLLKRAPAPPVETPSPAAPSTDGEPVTTPPESAVTPPGEGAGGASGDAAFRARLKALGFADIAIPADKAVIIGRVTSQPPAAAEGEASEPAPVAGAQVAAHRMGPDGVPDTRSDVLAQARSDGRFVMTVDREWGFLLRVTAIGHLEGRLELAAARLASGGADAGDILLQRPVRLVVTVTTGNAQIDEPVEPVPGMAVTVRLGEEDEEPLGEGTTDDDGRVVLEDLPATDVLVKGSLEPYAAFAQREQLVPDEHELRVNVDMVGRVRVRVMSPGGAKLESFRIALDFKHASYGYRAPRFADVTTEDPQGWHLIEDVKVGSHDLYATAPGFGLGTETADVRAGETTEVAVRLPLGFRVRGHVVEKGSGRPVAGAVVFSEEDLIPSSVDTNTRDRFRPMARATRCDVNGDFVLDDLTAGTHRLTAVHPDHASKSSAPARLGPDGVPSVTIEMPAGATLSGHVYDPEGQPVEGATVGVIDFMDFKNIKKKTPLMAQTDAGGFYRIEHIASGLKGIFKVSTELPTKEGKPAFEMKNHTFTDGQDAVMDFGNPVDGAVVTGRMTDPEGKPEQMIVMLTSANDMRDGKMPQWYQGTSDENGDYRIKGVPEGRYRVQFAPPGRGSDFAGIEEIDVPASGVLRRDFVLAGGSLRGRLVAEGTGAGLENGEVVLLAPDGRFLGRLTVNLGGEFVFVYVPEGTCSLVARAEGHVMESRQDVVIRAGARTDVGDLRLAPGGRVVGEVRDREGHPVAGANIELVDTSGKSVPVWAMPSLPDGSFTAESLPAGTWQITARKDGMTFSPATVTVEAGGTASAVISEPQ